MTPIAKRGPLVCLVLLYQCHSTKGEGFTNVTVSQSLFRNRFCCIQFKLLNVFIEKKYVFFFLGLVTAAHDLDIEWIVIKGVSDFADGKKSDTESWRPFASLMAASLVADILSDPIVFRDWPHYQGA